MLAGEEEGGGGKMRFWDLGKREPSACLKIAILVCTKFKKLFFKDPFHT